MVISSSVRIRWRDSIPQARKTGGGPQTMATIFAARNAINVLRELIDQIVDVVQHLPILLVVTFRPELAAPWVGLPQVTLLTLNRLPQEQMQSLIKRVTAGKSLPPEVLEQISGDPAVC
jgi:hypothetical protein